MTYTLCIPSLDATDKTKNDLTFKLTYIGMRNNNDCFTLSKRSDFFELIDKLTEFNQQNATMTQKLYETNYLILNSAENQAICKQELQQKLRESLFSTDPANFDNLLKEESGAI